MIEQNSALRYAKKIFLRDEYTCEGPLKPILKSNIEVGINLDMTSSDITAPLYEQLGEEGLKKLKLNPAYFFGGRR